jgi:predicted NUDIX family NTP pyrophosphohydrolase
MPRTSAGLLLHRRRAGTIEVLLVHPGGPFWARKDDGAWSIPKGEYEAGEDPLDVARREFTEELGSAPPAGSHTDLGEVTQRGGKRVRAWALAGDFDATSMVSNTFELEWPRGSGTIQEFPECDRAEWFTLEVAGRKLLGAQRPFLHRLAELVD